MKGSFGCLQSWAKSHFAWFLKCGVGGDANEESLVEGEGFVCVYSRELGQLNLLVILQKLLELQSRLEIIFNSCTAGVCRPGR